MATVTGFTADRMLEIEAASINGGSFDSSGNLILVQHDGTPVDAGSVQTATDTNKGIVELATSAEVTAGIDTTRAVTPAGIAAIPGTKVVIVSGIAESALPSAWPLGISMQSVTAGSGWTPAGGIGNIVTNYISASRCQQVFYNTAGGVTPIQEWIRSYHTTTGGGGWTNWQPVNVINNLIPANYTQATAFTLYADGTTRLYYTSANSTLWDFAGKAGEVVTYRDGADYAKQEWTSHVGGSSVSPEKWVRTANSTSGWSKWRVVAGDTGWITLTVGGAFTMKLPCAYRIKNEIVYMKGSVSYSGSGGSSYAGVVTLPSVAWPAEDKVFAVGTNSSVTMAAQVLAATGVVGASISGATTAWFSFSDITYPLG